MLCDQVDRARFLQPAINYLVMNLTMNLPSGQVGLVKSLKSKQPPMKDDPKILKIKTVTKNWKRMAA